jgi:hypothetical protein
LRQSENNCGVNKMSFETRLKKGIAKKEAEIEKER